MTIDGTEGGPIPLAQAAAMTAKYRLENPGAIKARLFGKDCINSLLNQGGGTTCKAIRMYYGINVDTGEPELILVGVDASGNDMLENIMDMSLPCPKACSSPNALNP